MGFHFTENQTKVLNARNHNILVSAAAGSGKTAVLVERIIRMISEGEKPLDIDRLLVVTFTRAAAAEMRGRIGRAISDRLEKEPDNRHLQRQETLLHHAQITTIDSFCSFLLRNNFSDIGLDPGCRQMDDTEEKLLRSDTLDKFVELQHEKNDPAFLAAADYFSAEGDGKLEELIGRLYSASNSHPSQKDWLLAHREDYSVQGEEDLLHQAWFRSLLLDVLDTIEDTKEIYRAIASICAQPDGPYPFADILEPDQEAVFAPFGITDPKKGLQQARGILLDESADTDALRDVFQKLAAGCAAPSSFAKLPSITKKMTTVSDEKKKLAGDLRKSVKEQLQKYNTEIFTADLRTLVSRMNRADAALRALVDTTISFIDMYAQVKKDRGLIDFSDLERFALLVLLERRENADGTVSYVPRSGAKAYEKYFDEVLIDEYQDSNEVQELLLSTIAGESDGRFARFMVGDVKQSIYRFRNARPEIFVRKFDTYKPDDPQCERIDLDQNFRSRPEVLDAVNAVFRKIMRREIGGVDYDAAAELKAGAVYPPLPEGMTDTAELLLVAGMPDEDTEEDAGKDTGKTSPDAAESAGETSADENDVASLSSHKKEALAVAQRIRRMAGYELVTDKETGQLRPVRYSDIVILLRSGGSWYDAFREIFELQGIPLYVDNKTGYFAAEEIREVLQLLRVIDNPRQDIALYGTLRGYFGGFSEDEIGRIRASFKPGEGSGTGAADKGQSGEDTFTFEGENQFLLDAVISYAGENTEAGRKCAAFLCFLDAWRERARTMPIHTLLEQLITQTGYDDYVTALPAGGQRRANLQALIVRAQDFEKTAFTGLFNFIRYIDQMRERKVDYGEANVLDENADVVRIMTIHKSKGLEFPVCFVCGTAGRLAFKGKDSQGSVIIDSDLGFGIDYIDTVYRSELATLRGLAVRDKIERDSLGEELRVLYVALTRAKEKLIITGYVRRHSAREKQLQKAAAGIAPGAGPLPVPVIRGASSYLDLIQLAFTAMTPAQQRDFRVEKQDITDLDLREVEEKLTLGVRKETLRAAREGGIAKLPIPALAMELDERFSFRYPHENLSSLFTKTTVTELKRVSEEENAVGTEEGATSLDGAVQLYPEKDPDVPVPRFAAESGTAAGTAASAATDSQYTGAVDTATSASGTLPAAGAGGQLKGARRGTAIHRALELIDFKRWPVPSQVTDDEIIAFVREKIDRKEMPAEYGDVLSPQVLRPFLHSEAAARMAAADARGELRREQPFVIGVPASRLGSDFPESETILIQGIIDAFFLEEGTNGKKIILLDYKTDYVREPEELISRYRVQLDYYKEALERTSGLPVAQKLIYSFRLQKLIEV